MHPQHPHFHVYSLMSVQDILVSENDRPSLRQDVSIPAGQCAGRMGGIVLWISGIYLGGSF